MSRTAFLRGRGRPLAFWALAGISLLVAHDLVILAQVGPGAELSRALRSGAHGYWGAASALLVLVGVAAALIAVHRLLRLRRMASELDLAMPARPRRYAARVAGLWVRLFAVVAVGFTLQENVEHLVGHAHLLGAGALFGPEYPLAVPVIGLITLIAAAIGAAVAAVERELVLVIAAALSRDPRRAPRTLQRPPVRVTPPSISLLARSGACRAPPALLLPTS